MQDRFNVRFWDIENKLYLYPDCYMQTAWNIGLGKRKTPLLYKLWSCIKYIPQQCTGLKDKNGKLIYEGDIVKFIDMGNQTGIVEFVSSCALFQVNYLTKEDWAFLDKREYEVIGNIYENPELLNEEEES